MNNSRDIKLCTKTYTKSHVAIHMTMSGNTHGKSCELKLNDMDCNVNYHTRFSASFGTQFGVCNIIQYIFLVIFLKIIFFYRFLRFINEIVYINPWVNLTLARG